MMGAGLLRQHLLSFDHYHTIPYEIPDQPTLHINMHCFTKALLLFLSVSGKGEEAHLLLARPCQLHGQ
jgi:hypothetical protein